MIIMFKEEGKIWFYFHEIMRTGNQSIEKNDTDEAEKILISPLMKLHQFTLENNALNFSIMLI